MACGCGYFFYGKISHLQKHLRSNAHYALMKLNGEVHSRGEGFFPDCNKAIQTQEQWDAHLVNKQYLEMKRCQSQEAGMFRRMTEADVTASKPGERYARSRCCGVLFETIEYT